jgi:hypothetical protein
MRKTALVSLIVLAFGACGSGVVATEPSPSVTDAPAAEAPGSPEATQPATGEPSAHPAIPDDAADAPDFTLLLGDGTSYTLSEDPKPVYLVFWAEW